jgi:deoxyribonuclease IV
MLIGSHVSVADGYEAALDYALSVGCECAQIFAKSPRQWAGSDIDAGKAERFRDRRVEVGFGPVFTHTAYLINLSTDDATLREKSVRALSDELVRAAVVGAAGVVTHVGNVPDGAPVEAARRAADSILQAFADAGAIASQCRLLLENTAGAGRTFGSTVAELADAVEHTGLGPAHLGICIDTCHGFAAGMELDTALGWGELLGELEGCLGRERLGLVHANDCLFERGARRDRHAWIGDGHIGMEGFAAMFEALRDSDACVCTEMPGEKPEKDAENISRLKRLRERAGV